MLKEQLILQNFQERFNSNLNKIIRIQNLDQDRKNGHQDHDHFVILKMISFLLKTIFNLLKILWPIKATLGKLSKHQNRFWIAFQLEFNLSNAKMSGLNLSQKVLKVQ